MWNIYTQVPKHMRVENTMPIKKTEGEAGVMEDQGRSKACKLDVCAGQRSRNYDKEYSSLYLGRHDTVGENYVPF